ncbi:M23 family metallopeptidase [Proteiniphilum sp. UBA5384]|uniref:M23 family metallopeptidase n=1 Tax=Proteiniphilum sp. UBA5384 TaxID=1947279 RepID=UPI0025FFE073|nr:M23 family metallopeptidase [Proteiniphilum sp. UBA5384]
MKHQTSVLIVNSKEKTSKVRQVPTHIIVHWRKYAAFLSLLIISFILVSGFLVYQNTSRFYLERLERANFVQSQIDLQKALTAFATIDSGMYRINLFLQDRGLEELRMENAGGISADFDIVLINEFADFYQKQLLGLEETLNSAPIGKPSDGNMTSGFGYRRNPFTGRNSEFHSGIDFKGQVGDSVKTTGSGIVTFAGYKGGYGRCVIIEHEKNLQTLYAHLWQINVKTGDHVNSGQLIGLMGSSGRSTGPHLHYEIINHGKRIDPKKYVSFEKKAESYG